MRRIMLVATVWLVMAAMMVILAIPVIAKNTGTEPTGPPFASGFGNPGTSSNVLHNVFGTGACVNHRGETTDQSGGACP